MSKSNPNLPTQIRVSIGTAILLDLLKGKTTVNPTTAYLMTYTENKCTANCGFCPQAKESKSRAEMLSRVTWPSFSTATLITALETAIQEGKVKRVCIQALNIPEIFLQLEALVKEIIKKKQTIDISVSCQPLNSQNTQLLKNAGVERIGIAIDASTETIFCKIKGTKGGGVYSWDKEINLLKEALLIFGTGKVSTHLIAGLGELEKDVAYLIQWCIDTGILPALFAFTPIQGTKLEKQPQPSIITYRRLQLARYLLIHNISHVKHMTFDAMGRINSFGVNTDILEDIIDKGEAFQTSGCPYCNRPFYNERPSGPLFNYPRKLSREEKEEIKRQLGFKEF